MGFSYRVFTVDEQDRIHRMSQKKFERLTWREPEEQCLEYSGRRIRFALVFVENENRKPVSIHKIEYGILAFDSKGRIGVEEQKRHMQLVAESTDFFGPAEQDEKNGSKDEKVIDATTHFAKRRMKNDFSWEPTAEIETAIVQSILQPEHRPEW
jgi:hypothetical protein